ncbi:MAG TPA: hypothetical protein ENL27_00965 [Candidatus Parcubacteria bacterium]|nr:hypothetical protein [Candidatus Parcubacteria bacterium]
MKEIEIEKVDKKEGRVRVRVGNNILTFCKKGKRVELVSRINPDAQLFDPAHQYVSSEIFKKATLKAAAILFSNKVSNRAPEQLSLF